MHCLNFSGLAQMGRIQSEVPLEEGMQHRRAGSYLGRVISGAEQGTQQEPRAEVALDLGPLGNFLLARSALQTNQKSPPKRPVHLHLLTRIASKTLRFEQQGDLFL